MADDVVEEAPVAVEEDPAVEEAPAVVLGDADLHLAVIEEAVVKTGAKTADSQEASYGWTAQQGDAPAEKFSPPGTVVTVAELPDKASLVEAGVDVDQFFSGLQDVVVADDAEREAVRSGK